MKTLYLKTKDEWTSFKYNELSELKEEFQERNIKIDFGVVIENHVKIGDNAEIGRYTEIGYNSRIGDGVVIGDDSEIGAYSKIGDGAEIGDRAKIGWHSKIGDNVAIGDGAEIGTNAEIEPNSVINHSIKISGTRHHVNWYSTGVIHIGCEIRSIKFWQMHYEYIAKEYDYSDAQIKEYETYIDMISELENSLKSL